MTSPPVKHITSFMLPARQLFDEVIAALRHTIAPAIPDPYPKAQAYMAAVILEFLSRQVEERQDIAREKRQALSALWQDLANILAGRELPAPEDTDHAARLCRVIEWLYREKDRLGPEVFMAANRRIRTTLRELLNQDLQIARTVEP
ncbi:MAG: hypothetical protein NZ578_04435 [Candidatus Binatia bacterium]|nr:hypothetical protein [Candidatus Binatia bacterium]